MKTLRLKVKPDSYAWLNAAAREVNFVWNWSAETCEKAIRRFVGPPKWLTGFDLTYLAAGASQFFEHIGADTINRVSREYAAKRFAARKVRLAWRKSGGSRRSLGWVPFRTESIRRKAKSIRFCGKSIRLFEFERLGATKIRDGQFAQDAVGDWWFCLPVAEEAAHEAAPREVVGIDLGLKDTATTSDGDRLQAGRYYRDTEAKHAQAQRRGHKRQAKRLQRTASRQRRDALHKFTTRIVGQYQKIIVGDVSSQKLVKTRMAKAVLDSGWGMLKQMLLYKGESAGRTVQIVDEAYTTRACSSCGSLSGPSGLRQLAERSWFCGDCGALHDRDINAAINIANFGARHTPSVCGNESRRSTPKRAAVVA